MDNTLDRALRDLFWLSLFLIAVAFFVGFATDAKVLLSGLKDLILVATGRDSTGKFANYPSGATLGQAA